MLDNFKTDEVCPYCLDCGIVEIEARVGVMDERRFMRCSCAIGVRQRDRLPVWDYALAGGFKRLKINSSEFVPKTSSIVEKAKWWTDLKQKSVEYWAGVGYVP